VEVTNGNKVLLWCLRWVRTETGLTYQESTVKSRYTENNQDRLVGKTGNDAPAASNERSYRRCKRKVGDQGPSGIGSHVHDKG